MKRKWLTALFLLGLPFTGQSQYLCNVENGVFRSGERLSYQLYYNVSFVWIQAGTCEFKVRNAVYNKKPSYQLMMEGKTQKSFEPFFKVRDTLISYVDTQSLYPMKSFKFTHEDKWHGVDEYTFQPVNGKWKIWTRLKRKQVWKPTVESYTDKCGFDMLTSIYRLRCFSDPSLYKVGRKLDIPVRLDDGEYVVHLTYLGKQRIKLYGSGYYDAHAFSLSLIAGTVFKRGDVLKMWVSDDKNRIPLMIESPIRVGTVKAIFRSAENTLYPAPRSSAE